MAVAGEAVKAGEKVVGKITRQGAREQAMTRGEYKQTYGEEGKGLFEKVSDAVDSFSKKRDERTYAKYGDFKYHDQASIMRQEMRNAKLRPLKAFAGSKFGKIAMLGAGLMYFMNGGLALPLKAMNSMIAGLAGGGLAGMLLSPLKAANKSVESANHSLDQGNAQLDAEGNNPFRNSEKAMAATKKTAAKNAVKEQEPYQDKQSSKQADNEDDLEQG